MWVCPTSHVPGTGWCTCRSSRRLCGPVELCQLPRCLNAASSKRMTPNNKLYAVWWDSYQVRLTLVMARSLNRRRSCYSICSYSVSLSCFYISIFFLCLDLVSDVLGSEKYRLSWQTALDSFQDPHINRSIYPLCSEPVCCQTHLFFSERIHHKIIQNMVLTSDSASCCHAQFLFDFLH